MLRAIQSLQLSGLRAEYPVVLCRDQTLTAASRPTRLMLIDSIFSPDYVCPTLADLGLFAVGGG